MDNFYKDLPAFSEFGKITNFASYAPVPEDWVVALADIRGSTPAIEQGHYKDVNMAGAASITAILNACKPLEIPFVFGGDGGTVILPGSYAPRAAGALSGLQSFVRDSLDLDLRIGVIPVSRLRADGHDVLVRKFELSPGNFLAMMTGGGLEHADTLLKSAHDPAALMDVEIDSSAAPDLDGLSCRWEPLRPRSGHMIALLIKEICHLEESQPEISRVMADIERILGQDTASVAPANERSLRYRWPPKGLKLEAALTAGATTLVRHITWLLRQSFYQYLCERFRIKLGDYDGAKYREELKTNTDFRKYDDMLRLVLDVSPEQLERIDRLLDEEYRAGKLVYGLHVADSALMTCLIFDLAQSQHVHFIDAANGGFARAAIDFKSRLRARSGD